MREDFLFLAETLQAGHNIEELISHGLELLSYLLPPTSSPDDLRLFYNNCDHFTFLIIGF